MNNSYKTFQIFDKRFEILNATVFSMTAPNAPKQEFSLFSCFLY